MSKNLSALIVAGIFVLNAVPLIYTSSVARAEPAGSMSNTPPGGKPDMSNQPDRKIVKQPATSAEKKKTDSDTSAPK